MLPALRKAATSLAPPYLPETGNPELDQEINHDIGAMAEVEPRADRSAGRSSYVFEGNEMAPLSAGAR